MLAMERQGISLKDREGKRVMIIPIGNELKARAIELACVVRESGIPVSIEVMGRSVSRALKDANRRNVTHSIIVGPEEIKEGKVVLRNMKRREQRTTKIESVLKHIMK
jgi:histidyl-tRNA synthetase